MNQHTILIVDDEELILEITSKALTYDHYRIFTAINAEEALSILENNDIRLVISDQKMPGLSGIDFLKQVKSKYPDILTIMLTGYADIDVAIDAINLAGVYKFILKPWDTAELRITVKRALELRHLVMERDSLLDRIKTQEAVFEEMEKKYPGITKVDRDQDGVVIVKV